MHLKLQKIFTQCCTRPRDHGKSDNDTFLGAEKYFCNGSFFSKTSNCYFFSDDCDFRFSVHFSVLNFFNFLEKLSAPVTLARYPIYIAFFFHLKKKDSTSGRELCLCIPIAFFQVFNNTYLLWRNLSCLRVFGNPLGPWRPRNLSSFQNCTNNANITKLYDYMAQKLSYMSVQMSTLFFAIK